MVTKRICVQHTTGPLTGIYQTVGLSHPDDMSFPSHLTHVWFNGREINAVLVRAEDRYVLYREEPIALRVSCAEGVAPEQSSAPLLSGGQRGEGKTNELD